MLGKEVDTNAKEKPRTDEDENPLRGHSLRRTWSDHCSYNLWFRESRYGTSGLETEKNSERIGVITMSTFNERLPRLPKDFGLRNSALSRGDRLIRKSDQGPSVTLGFERMRS